MQKENIREGRTNRSKPNKPKKSFNIKQIEKYKKEIRIALIIIFVVLAILVIFPSKKIHVLRRYKHSINTLSKEDKYNVKLLRKREKYSETIKESSKKYDKYINRLDINVFEYVDLKEDKLVTFFERDKKQLEEKAPNKKDLELKEDMYFPLLNKEKKFKKRNLKLKNEKYNEKDRYVLNYKIDDIEYNLYLDKETYYPLLYTISLKNDKDKEIMIKYEYQIIKGETEDRDFEKAQDLKYINIKDQEEKERYQSKKAEINIIGIRN